MHSSFGELEPQTNRGIFVTMLVAMQQLFRLFNVTNALFLKINVKNLLKGL